MVTIDEENIINDSKGFWNFTKILYEFRKLFAISFAIQLNFFFFSSLTISQHKTKNTIALQLTLNYVLNCKLSSVCTEMLREMCG